MYNMPEHPLTREELKRRLEAVDGAKICLIGDSAWIFTGTPTCA